VKSLKLTWHDGNQVWSKIIGKRRSKRGKTLVQAQWYFTPNREESLILAAARQVEWRRLEKGWDGHRVLLDVTGDAFANIPHWIEKRPQQRTAEVQEIIEAFRRRQPPQSEVAEMHRDLVVGDCASLFMSHRKKREGVDFKPTTNKSLKIDLDGALRAIDGRILMMELMPSHLDEQRVVLLKTCGSTNTAKNYGRAMKMMLDWYYDSVYFFGGLIPKGIGEVFGRYPKKRPSKPKHLPFDVLKLIFSEASRRRRLYLMLMLNTGMQPTDIPQLRQDSFSLTKSTVNWYRQKNERVKDPSSHQITSYLWPETLDLVRQLIGNKPGPAFLTIDGKPLSHESVSNNRQNAVTKSLTKFFKRISRVHTADASAKHFRQTGAQLIYEATEDYALSQIWLGRKFRVVDQPYLRQVFSRLENASEVVRERLLDAGVFRFNLEGSKLAPVLAKGA
jgi:integrase